MVELSAMRQGPLDRLAGAQARARLPSCPLLPPRAKFVLRCRPDAIAAAGRAFGVALPRRRHAAPRLREIARRCGSARTNGFCSRRKTMRKRSLARSRAALGGTHHSLRRRQSSQLRLHRAGPASCNPDQSRLSARSLARRHFRSGCARARCSRKPRSFSGASTSIRTMSRSSVHSRRTSGICSSKRARNSHDLARTSPRRASDIGEARFIR